MTLERLCPQCGTTHKVRRITKVYCSTLCRVNASNAKRRLPLQQSIPPEETMKEEQREQATAEAIRDYVDRNVGRMTAREMAANLGVSLYIIQRLMPNPSR